MYLQSPLYVVDDLYGGTVRVAGERLADGAVLHGAGRTHARLLTIDRLTRWALDTPSLKHNGTIDFQQF